MSNSLVLATEVPLHLVHIAPYEMEEELIDFSFDIASAAEAAP